MDKNKAIGGQTLDSRIEEDSGIEEEDVSQAFICCVCMDLLYKPIVLACGHISCFWCVHRAMNGWHESRCPVCRHPYNHFPTICQLLNFLLLKMYPAAYKRREKEVLEEEKEAGCFSPQIDDHLAGSHTNKELNLLGYPPPSSTGFSQTNLYSYTCSIGKGEPYAIVEPSEISTLCKDNFVTIPEKSFSGNLEATRNVAVEQNGLHDNGLKDGACTQVSVADVLCATCKQLLFRPVVLNCGHVCCESCIVIPVDEMLRCPVCQIRHPKGFPKVCLELDHFLEEQFSKDYALRREAVQLKQVLCQRSRQAGIQGAQSSSSSFKNRFSWWSCIRSKVHFGVGCDYCGMYPIIGERYRCKDCVEAIGFDLCGDCYNTRSKRPGRFNQQHVPEHKFERIQSEDGSAAPVLSDDFSEDLEEGSLAPILSGDARVDPEDGLVTLITSNNTPDDQKSTNSTI